MKLISVNDISYAYDDKIVLKNLNFEVYKGDYLCIIGSNGAGKSTLIKGILGLKNSVDNKEIVFNNIKNIGYLAQKTSIKKDFPASVNEVVLSGTLKRDVFGIFYSKKQKEIAKSNMQKLGIYDIRHKSIQTLSGGQIQRMLLGRALCASDEILLLDEPVTGLDPIITEEFYQLIKKLNQSGVTIIMVSHDIECAIKYANKILHLQNEQLFFGTNKEYLESDVAKEFLRGAHVHNK